MAINTYINSLKTDKANLNNVLVNNGIDTVETDTITTLTEKAGAIESAQGCFSETVSAGNSSMAGILKSIASIPSTLKINGTSGNYMFYGCSSLKRIPAIDTSALTKADYMFANCSSLEEIGEMD